MSWENQYSKKLQTADEALNHVRSGMRVYIQPGCAEPETLVEALKNQGACTTRFTYPVGEHLPDEEGEADGEERQAKAG